jgi:hypothetical protein
LPSGQCTQRAIAEAKHRSSRSVIGWVIKIYYLEVLLASEGTLSCWSRLHLQSLASTPVSKRVDVRQARKNQCRIFITTLPTPLSGLRVGKRKKEYVYNIFLSGKILEYINNAKDVQTFNQYKSRIMPSNGSQGEDEQDTSWIALFMSYISCRAIVLWIINFWIVKDNYLEGLQFYRKLSTLLVLCGVRDSTKE